jgi:hypothetical protein
MKIEQFKKAAKRYSASANLPLNEAQEQMAAFFGFKNFDAARKSLEPKSATTPTEQAHDWIFSATADEIIQKVKYFADPISDDNKVGLERREKAFDLLEGIVTALCYLRKTKSITINAQVLIEYLSLNKIEELYLIGHEEFKSSGAVPQEFMKVKNYLDAGLPRYAVSKLLISSAIADMPAIHVLSKGSTIGKTEQDISAYENHAVCCGWLIQPISAMLKNGQDDSQIERRVRSAPSFPA